MAPVGQGRYTITDGSLDDDSAKVNNLRRRKKRITSTREKIVGNRTITGPHFDPAKAEKPRQRRLMDSQEQTVGGKTRKKRTGKKGELVRAS